MFSQYSEHNNAMFTLLASPLPMHAHHVASVVRVCAVAAWLRAPLALRNRPLWSDM